jgi:hypothetical protein
LREVRRVASLRGVFVELIGAVTFDSGVSKELKVLHNSESLRKHVAGLVVGESILYETWVKLVASAVQEEMSKREQRLPPAAPSLRAAWAIGQVKDATKRLQGEAIAQGVAAKVVSLVNGMVRGKERQHLEELLRWTDYRGSDVRLVTGELLEGSRQECPCPATAWKWRSVLAWPWRRQQHINVLEFTAFLTYLRSKVAQRSFHGQRVFHVFDSRVAACVVAKGRSCSRVLNRISRRLLGFVVASNTYVLTLWTVSNWNFSDAASRLHLPANDG